MAHVLIGKPATSGHARRLTPLPGPAQSDGVMTLARPSAGSARDANRCAGPARAPAGAGAADRHGRSQRHAGLLFRRRPLPRSRDAPSSRPRGMVARRRRHPRRRRGIDPALWRHAVAVPAEEEMRRLAPVLPAVVALGVPVSIDTMKAKVAAWALERGAAIVNDVWGLQRDPDMARVVAEHARAGDRHAQPRRGRSGDRHHGRHRGVLRPLARRSPTRAGIAREQHRARSRHRLRQDAGAEHHRHRAARRAASRSACRCWSAPRASASSTRCRPRRPTGGSADRSPRISSRSRTARRSSAPTTSPRPCRRCASPPPSGSAR